MVTRLKSGEKVILPKLTKIKKEILATAFAVAISCNQDVFARTIEFDRYIGQSDIIRTRNDSYIQYYSIDKKTWTRVQIASSEQRTSQITILLGRIDNNTYKLIDCWYGEYSPNPDDKVMLEKFGWNRKESLTFWESHAYVRSSVEFSTEYDDTGAITKPVYVVTNVPWI